MSFSKAASCSLRNVVHLRNVHYVLYVKSGCPYSFVFWSFVVLFILLRLPLCLLLFGTACAQVVVTVFGVSIQSTPTFCSEAP